MFSIQEAIMNCRLMVPVVMLCCAISIARSARRSRPTSLRLGWSRRLWRPRKSYVESRQKKGDVAFFKRILTSDFSFVPFDGQLADRQDMIDQLGGGASTFSPTT